MRRNGGAFTHREKKIGDAFITFYVAFIRRLRCVYRNRKQKCNLPPLVILVVVRELFRLGLDVMEPFSCSYSLCLAREKNGCCADVWSSSQRLVWCLSLLVDREDYCASRVWTWPFGSTEFFHSPGFSCLLYLQMWDVSMSSRDVLFLWDVSEEVRSRIFSSFYDLILPPTM